MPVYGLSHFSLLLQFIHIMRLTEGTILRMTQSDFNTGY